MTGKKVRVLLADDHTIVLEGLRYVLGKQPHIEVVAAASNGLDAVRLAEELNPDIVVLDLKMPVMDGITAAEQLIEKQPSAQIIVLSANINSMVFHRGLKAGILGFVDKESVFSEIVQAIDEVAVGHSYYCQTVRSLMAANLKQMLNPTSVRRHDLTSEDRELIALLTDGKSIGQIALQVKKSPKTIDARRRRIMQRLGFSSLAELTKYAIAEGITSPELQYS